MTIQVYPHNDQEEKALLEFLSSRHYDYRETVKEETEEPDAEFLDEYNRELDEGEAQIDAGEYMTHEEVKQFFAEKRKRILGN
jgi:predicted transcriptional regulator